MNLRQANISGAASSENTEQTAIDVGRYLLDEWNKAQPNNFFTADVNLQRVLEFHWGRDKYKALAPDLYRFGGVSATVVDQAVQEANRDENLPRLNRYDGVGGRIEEVVYHPAHHRAGRYIYNSGMLSAYGQPGNNLLALVLFYLSAQNGEAGHNCPVACSAGLIKALQAVGGRHLQERFLPSLLDSKYETLIQGAQFLTEVQGGSDVGANATWAEPSDRLPGTWLLNGEKWFCSNITAELALVTARVAGQGMGTRGLGLFLVPRTLEDGRPNGIFIHRLKEKLGTRSMATGEISFENSQALQVGSTERGFKNVMTYVINTSRIYNAMAVTGNARRAYVVARAYAEHRRAFGQPIIHFPLVQDMLANMRADVTAMLSGTMQIARLLDDIELDRSNPQTEAFLRMAINLNKYRSAVLAHEVINQAIEVLGGNGTIETFSVLPRLLRDNIVYENWEGTHNVLLAQVQRDIRRYRVDKPFVEVVNRMFSNLSDDGLRSQGVAELERIVKELEEIKAMDDLTGAIYFRPLMDRLTALFYSASMASEGDWELEEKQDRTKIRLAGLFMKRRTLGLEPKDIAYYDDIVSRLC